MKPLLKRRNIIIIIVFTLERTKWSAAVQSVFLLVALKVPGDWALSGDGVLSGPHPGPEDVQPVGAPLSPQMLEVLLTAQGVPVDLYREASPQSVLQLVLALLRWFWATSYVHYCPVFVMSGYSKSECRVLAWDKTKLEQCLTQFQEWSKECDPCQQWL